MGETSQPSPKKIPIKLVQSGYCRHQQFGTLLPPSQEKKKKKKKIIITLKQ